MLFFAISNNDPISRYAITDYLLDIGTDANVLNECGETLLHVLFSRVKHDLPKTIALCERLLLAGVDINHCDNKHRVALQYVINMKYSDEDLMPLYTLLFSIGNMNTNIKNDWGKSPYELAKSIPYRTKLVSLMEKGYSKDYE